MKIKYCHEGDKIHQSFVASFPVSSKVVVPNTDSISDLAPYHKFFKEYDGGEAIFVLCAEPYWMVSDDNAAVLASISL